VTDVGIADLKSPVRAADQQVCVPCEVEFSDRWQPLP
jgi:hypothetical protein